MRRILTLCAAAMTLAACSRPQPAGADHNTTIVIPGANGASTVIGNQTPTNLPAYVKVFPGAKVMASLSTPKGGMLVLDVAAPPEAVLDFYKKGATDAGMTSGLDTWAMGNDTSHTGAHAVVFSKEGTEQSLSATVESSDGTTKATLLYGAS